MKKCSTSYVIREMQTNTRYHYTPVRMAKIQNTDSNRCSQVWWCGATGTLSQCWWKCKMVQPLWEMFWQLLTNLTYWQHRIQPWFSLVVTQRSWELMSRQKCTWMFTETLFIISKIWRQSRYPSVDWVDKYCGTFKEILFSAEKTRVTMPSKDMEET